MDMQKERVERDAAPEKGIRYGILANPGHNRVYFDASAGMSLAELEIAARRFQAACDDFRILEPEGIRLVTFRAAQPLQEADLALLSRLSFVYALFELENRADGRSALLPIRRRLSGFLGEDVGTILKYSGKTNELFTRMMLNVGILSGDFAEEADICLLDPVAGKGTTLYEAAILGWDAYGVEIAEKSVLEARTYFKKYLETGKYKHTMEKERISGEGRSFRSEMTRFEYAVSKEAQRQGRMRRLVLVEGDSRHANRYFKRNQFHLIVGDLPYGVQHGSQGEPADAGGAGSRSGGRRGGSGAGQGGSGTPTRNPKELVRACLPAWLDILRPGGTIVLAWNRFVLERAELADVFRVKGLTVLDEAPYDAFVHRVDQSILRDIMVVRKERDA